MVNRRTSLVPRVRQCWVCATSVQDDALSSHPIVKRDTRRLKSCGMISAPWSPSFSRSQGSQKNEALSVSETPGSCRLRRICLPSTNFVLCTTPEASRSTMVAASTSASSTETTGSTIRSCAASTALFGSDHTTRKNHLGTRADARSQCLPCRSFHSNL